MIWRERDEKRQRSFGYVRQSELMMKILVVVKDTKRDMPGRGVWCCCMILIIEPCSPSESFQGMMREDGEIIGGYAVHGDGSGLS